MPETKAQSELKNAVSNLDIASLQKQDVITSSNYQKSYQKVLKNIDQDMAQQDIQDVETAIRVTDVSQPRDGVSPHTHLKTIAKAAETGAKIDISEIPAELQALASNKVLLQTASILSDADLTPSAGTTYDFNQRMTENLHGEVPAIAVGPGTTQFFCQQIVGGEFTSAAGQKHSNASLTGMVNTAKKISMQLENANKVETPKAKKDGTSNKI